MTDLDLPAGARPIPNQPDHDTPPPLEPAGTNSNGHRPKPQPKRDPLPHDLDAERHLLGAALLGNTDALIGVPDAAFYAPAHAAIAHSIRTLHDQGAYIDAVTVGDHVRTTGQLDLIGGPTTIPTILAACPASSGGTAYAQIVLNHWSSRRLIHAAEEARHLAAHQGADAARAHLTTVLDNLSILRSTIVDDPDLDDFLDQVDQDYDWLVPGLLEHRDRVVITAEEGTGKSTLLRQIAVQLASGIHPFTHAPIDPYRVLYVDCENSPRQARRALRNLREAAGDNYQPGHLRLRVLGEAMAIGDPVIEADLAARIAHHHIDLVVIGPLYKLVTGDPVKEEPAKAVADAIDRLRNIRGSAFLIEAHSPYAEGHGKKRPIRPYGASLWSRWPEFGFHLAPDGQITHWRGQREGRDWPPSLQRATPWPWTPGTAPAPTWDGPTECLDAIVAFIREAGGDHTLRQLGTRLRERNLSYRSQTIATAARMAAERGLLEQRTGARGALVYSPGIPTLSDQPTPTQTTWEEF